MKLVELVAYFRNGGNFDGFCREQALKIGAELEIYARAPVTLESQLGFFAIERTGGKLEVLSEGMRYENLFDFSYFLDAIEESKDRRSLGDAELAEILLSYALNDA